MSSNLSVSNFSIGGSLGVSGVVTLAEPITSASTASFTGLSTTNLPTCNQSPTTNTQLTNKLYVDNTGTTLNGRITSTDSAQKTYIDNVGITLNGRITSTDSEQRTYIDEQINIIKRERPVFYVYVNNGPTTFRNDFYSNAGMEGILYNVNGNYTDNRLFGKGNPGYYQINTSITLTNVSFGSVSFFKNDVEFSRGGFFSSSTTQTEVTLTGSTVIYLNDSSTDPDTVDVRLKCNPTSTLTSSITKKFFSGHFISP